MSTSAKVIADSVSPQGVRLTTFQVTFHRFVLAEFNTHRTLSRNSASNRAIPVGKTMQAVFADPAYPVSWPLEQKGMQGGEPISGSAQFEAESVWVAASQDALRHAKRLTALGRRGDEAVHKSVINRLLEPFQWHTVVLTATAWENFFAQRLDADAQPEIRVAAEAMEAAMDASTPRLVMDNVWHLPYVQPLPVAPNGIGVDPDAEDPEDWKAAWEIAKASDQFQNAAQVLIRVSAARCARVSYLTQEGKRDIAEDLRLYDRLTKERSDIGKPLHWSPLEHVATPWDWNRQEGCIHFGQDPALVGVEDTFTCVPLDHLPRTGNLLGWRNLRTEVEASMHERTYR